MSLNEEIVDLGSRVLELKMVTVAECVAAKSKGVFGAKDKEVMDEISVGFGCLGLNDFQYFASGVCLDLEFEDGLSLGFTGNDSTAIVVEDEGCLWFKVLKKIRFRVLL